MAIKPLGARSLGEPTNDGKVGTPKLFNGDGSSAMAIFLTQVYSYTGSLGIIEIKHVIVGVKGADTA